MKIFQYRRGSTRIAIILCNLIVIKIANPFRWGFKGFIKSLRHEWRREGFLKETWIRITQDFLLGVGANVTEGFLCKRDNTSFLIPVKCFLIFNLQRYVGEEEPSEEELKVFFDTLKENGVKMIYCIDPHQYEPCNWRIVDGRIRLIDYGGKIYNDANFSAILLRFSEQLEEAFSRPVR